MENYREGLYVSEDSLVFDYSNDEGVRIKLGTKVMKYAPYTKTINGVLVKSLYSISSENKNILRILKGESDILVQDKDLEYFANRSALYAFTLIDKDIDLILYSESSYPMFEMFVSSLKKKFSSKILISSPSIFKTNSSSIEIKKNTPEKYLKDVTIILSSLKKKETIKLRNDIPLKFRSYFTGFISIKDEIQKQIEGKNVLVVDDILTSGSTFSEIFDILKIRKASNIYGLSIFKF